ncbi:MAG: Der GTPase-activating protein YihI [Vibrionaceae bacterium]
MTRKKKARRQGSEGEAQYSEKRMSEQEMLSLLRKKQAKHKGLKAGSRHSAGEKNTQQRTAQKANDPRLGSKKPVPLIVEAPAASKKMSLDAQKRNAEKELELLENDPQLIVLLDRIDNGERLGAGLQAYVDEKLDKIEQLMSILGLLEPEEDEQTQLCLTDEAAASRVNASKE